MSDDIRNALHDELAHHRAVVALAEAERQSAEAKAQLEATQRELAEREAAAKTTDWGAMSPNEFHDELGRRGW